MPSTPSRRAARLLLGLVVCAVLALAAAPAVAKGSAKPATKFAAFEAAWRARSAESLAKVMEPKQAVAFRLDARPFNGKSRSMRPKQALSTLKQYFKGVSVETLKDVTPKRSPANVRLYDYTYKPTGASRQTTRLSVQLKQDRNRLWVLASVTESPKPRP